MKPLTILQMLETDGPGGAETVMFQLAEELRRRGHRVTPVGPEHGAGWLSKRFRDAGFDAATFSLARAIDPGCVRRLAALIRATGADLVHSHEFSMAVYGSAATAVTGVRHIMTMHGPNPRITAALRRRVALKLAFRKGGTPVAVSRATKVELERVLGLPSGVMRVVHNGVPLRTGSPDAVRREFGIQAQELVLLAVGNLEPWKGHLILLRALHRLTEGGMARPWRLLIAGGRGGSDAGAMQQFVTEHDMQARVHILAHRADVPDLQAASDVFVMPSLWEGLPLAMLEAMVASRAIIASDTSGIPEAVTDGIEGLLVPPGDEAALSQALARMLSDDALRSALGHAAGERARRDFSLQCMTDRYELLYRASR
jgi:glycosyltransferase involved in cell wall biosynthesis